MDINGGQLTQTNGNPVFPGTVFTGPLIAGNIIHSDGSNAAAGLGETNTGTANQGYVVMAQTAIITQVTGAQTTAIVIPAQSQITAIQCAITTAWTTGTTTFGVGATAGTTNATAFTAAGALAGGTANTIATALPSTAAQTANWDNVSNSTFQSGGAADVIITVTSGGGAGSGVGTLTVFYLQGINNAS